jgi:hypothetical protein
MVVALRESGSLPCRIPVSVEVRLTDARGATEAEALSAPASNSTLAMGPSTQAGLTLTWVRQGCFTPAVRAAGGYLRWNSPTGLVDVTIAGIPEADVAPCHDAFGVTDLQLGVPAS